MKIAFSSKTYAFLPLNEALEVIAKAGFSYVEILAEKPHLMPEKFNASSAVELSERLKKNGLTVTSIDTALTHITCDDDSQVVCSWLSEDWRERERRIRYTLDCARIAAAMGVSQIAISAGSPVPDTMDAKEAWRLFVANMFRVLPIVEKLGITVTLRPSRGILIESAEQLLSFLKEMEFHPFLGVDLDLAHAYCYGNDPCEVFKLLAPHVKNIHISDGICGPTCRHLPFGEGTLEVPKFTECLKEYKYDGLITICFDASGKFPEEVARQSRAYIKRLLG
ncbi:MAG: sugar phosphate isomerase/epimerase [Syntrophobacterales bacterium]|nr:sugar phosphate isomerase/epimerase [Syntrophobacterales bacterium]